MSDLKVLVWKNPEGTGDPEAEVKVPVSLAKWVPRMMKFIPRKTKEETWGTDINFDDMFADLEKLVQEAAQSGQKELVDVKTRDSHVKVLVEA